MLWRFLWILPDKVHVTIPVQCFLSFHEHSNCKCFCPMAQHLLTAGLAELCVICPGMSFHIGLYLWQVLTVTKHQCQQQGFAESTWKSCMICKIIAQSIQMIALNDANTPTTQWSLNSTSSKYHTTRKAGFNITVPLIYIGGDDKVNQWANAKNT